MRNTRGNILVLFFLILLTGLYSCGGDELTGPDRPAIELMSIKLDKNPQGYDTLISITFSYEDGNGDLGYRDGDTFPPFDFNSKYFYNLMVEYESKEDGIYTVPAPLGAPVNFSERFASLTPEGKNKSIKGEMTLRFPAEIFGLTEQPDSIRCKIKLVDRALHESNVITTDDIHLNQQP